MGKVTMFVCQYFPLSARKMEGKVKVSPSFGRVRRRLAVYDNCREVLFFGCMIFRAFSYCKMPAELGGASRGLGVVTFAAFGGLRLKLQLT